MVAIGLYLAAILLLNIPHVQRHVSAWVSKELSQILQTRVDIEQINMGLLNRIILDNVCIEDRSGKPLLESERMSAKFSLPSLLEGRITIHNIQLHRFRLHLSRQDSLAAPNYQFLIDALTSDTASADSPEPDLRINTLLVRRGEVSYDCLSAPQTPGRFNPQHVRLEDLRANISLKALMEDSIHTTVRQLSFREKSGFDLKKLAFKLVGNRQAFTLTRFVLELPGTVLRLDTLQAHYDAAAEDIGQTFRFRGGIADSYFTPQDVSSLAPSLAHFKDRLLVRARLQGNNREITLSPFQIRSDNNDISFRFNARIRNPWNNELRFFDCRLSEANISSTGMRFLSRNLNAQIPPLLNRMGYVSLQGYARGMLKNLHTETTFACGLGTVNSSLQLNLAPNQTSYQGRLYTAGFQLGALLNNPDWGNITLQTEINGTKDNLHPLFLQVKGHIPALDYKQHTYRDIRLAAYHRGGAYDGYVYINDPNGQLSLRGFFAPNARIPEYRLTATLRGFRPHDLGLIQPHADTEFSLRLHTDFQGNHLDNLAGRIRIDSLRMQSPTDTYCLDSLTLVSYPQGEHRELAILSPFLQGHVAGKFQFATLPHSVQQVLHGYLPSVFRSPAKHKKSATANRLTFEFTMKNAELFNKVLNIPVSLQRPVCLTGFFHERNQQLNVEGYFPLFTYQGRQYQSGMLLVNNPAGQLQSTFRISKQTHEPGHYVNLALRLHAKDDRLQTTLHWGNNASTTYSGTFAATTRFIRQNLPDTPALGARIQIHPADIIINDTVWNLRPSTARIDSGRIHVDHFKFEHNHQYLHVNGSLTEQADDSLQIDLNQIKLEYIFDIINFHPVDFHGRASGRAVVKQVLKHPSLLAKLRVEDFRFNHGPMGHMELSGQWNEQEGNIHLDADIREHGRSRTTVQGWVSPKRNGLDLHIATDSTNLAFLNHYTSGIFRRLDGRVSGPVHLFGPFSNLNLEGDVSGNAHVLVDVLHTDYRLQLDSVSLRPNRIEFRKARFADRQGHSGALHGTLRHNHLRNMSYDFTFQPRDMLIYDAPNDTESSIYGSIQANGSIRLSGGGNQLDIQANLRTSPHTTFVYNLGTPEEITNNAFITFVDKTPRPSWQQPPASSSQPEETPQESTMDIRIGGQLEVTPDATVKVIVDPISGDYATAQGRGNFQANYFNKGDFKLYGTYTLDHGLYKLSLQEVIRKDFQLQQGGTITFNGKPENGDMDLQAVYTVNSASLRDLSPNAAFSQNSVRVNCLLNLTGRIDSPTILFDLDLPNASEEEADWVRNYISTDEQMETQIIYLLGLGRFYSYEYANNPQQDTGQSSAMNSLLSSTLSGQLNNMLSRIIDSNQWNFGTNLSTGERGWNDMEVEGMLSGRLLNNRLLINGNFGYRENQLSNTNFIGDFDVQWLLTPSGDIRLKGYNQTNDRYFTKTTLTTQGIGILFQRDFDHWLELFFRRRAAQLNSTRTDSVAPASRTVRKKEKKKRKRWFWEFD